MSRKSDASSPSGGIQTATGIYTGDGAATQAIAGVGFQPRFVMIYSHSAPQIAEGPIALKSDQDGVNASWYWAGGRSYRYEADTIISFDADGFTVGDGTPLGVNIYNVLNVVYSYMCFR